MKNIKIGIQKKGELTEESIKFLKSLGLIFQRKEKQLSSLCVNTNIEIIYLRDDDIPSLVEQGYLDYGIVGEDIIFEQNLRFTIQNKLDFGRCRIVIAVDKKSDIRSITDFNGKTIATSFPNITRAFFKKARKLTR